MPEGTSTTRAHEQELLQRARRLDDGALGEIFDSYYEPLYRYIYRRIGVGQIAEDLAADVFRTFLEQLQSGRGPDTFLRAWLYRVAHNLMVDELRRKPHLDHERLEDGPHDTSPAVNELAQSSFERQNALAALQHLTDKQRAVLELKYLQGLDLAEIALTLKMKIGTVKALQFRGLEAMRRYLRQIGALDETDQ
jgi:RNA polymerase sigma-70 factor (ECF subfamily)